MRYVTYLTTYTGLLLPPKYIGSTSESTALSGNYFGSIVSKKWKDIFKKELKTNKHLFSLKILSYHNTRIEALEEELRLQKENDVVSSKKYFNEAFASKSFFHGNHHTEETKKIIREKRKNQIFTAETRTTLSQSFKKTWENEEKRKILSKANSVKNKGRKHTEESKKNMSDAHIGFKQTEEQVNKRVQKLIGQKRTDEFKNFLSKLHKGKIATEATKKKMSDSTKLRYSTMSEEEKKKISQAASVWFSKPRKRFKLISPIGTTYIFDGLRAALNFAKEQGLSTTLLITWKNKGKIKSTFHSQEAKKSIDWQLSLISLISKIQ